MLVSYSFVTVLMQLELVQNYVRAAVLLVVPSWSCAAYASPIMPSHLCPCSFSFVIVQLVIVQNCVRVALLLTRLCSCIFVIVHLVIVQNCDRAELCPCPCRILSVQFCADSFVLARARALLWLCRIVPVQRTALSV